MDMPIDTGVMGVLALNALAWVWGAGRLMQSVKSLEKTSTKLEEAVEKLSGMLGEHAERLAALEAVNNHRRLGD
jgi:hypothetical protein